MFWEVNVCSLGCRSWPFKRSCSTLRQPCLDVVSKFTSVTRDEIKENGGFAHIVESGDGLVVPPGHLLAEHHGFCGRAV